MADMGKDPGSRPWWESRLDWTLRENLEITLRMSRDLFRNIPQTLSAYRLGKASPLDELEPDPIEKIADIKIPEPVVATKAKVAKAPKVLPPPPPPPVQWGIRAVNMPPVTKPTSLSATQPKMDTMREKLRKMEQTLQQVIAREERKAMSLEQLLDPDFDEYLKPS
jgi:hypothetical protein